MAARLVQEDASYLPVGTEYNDTTMAAELHQLEEELGFPSNPRDKGKGKMVSSSDDEGAPWNRGGAHRESHSIEMDYSYRGSHGDFSGSDVETGLPWMFATITLLIFPGLKPSTKPKLNDYGSKVVPCGVATGLDIGLSNLSLRSITLSFYTMCKSSSLAFVLLFAFAFRLERPSWKLAGIIVIITGGVILMVSTETQFDLAGMVEVLSASALGGLRWSLTQILLDKESMGMGNPIATLFWLAPIMGVTLATTSMIVDGWGNVFSHPEFFGSFWRTLKTAGAIFLPGVLAFSMNVTEFGLIQRTSVVTLSVAGIFKEVAVIFLSMFIFHDQLTPINVSGLVVTLFGIALYNYLKYEQFTSGEGGHGHGHGHGGHSAGPKPLPTVPEDSHGEEDDTLLGSPRARNIARVLGTRNESATAFHDYEGDFQAPLHSLGRSSSDSDRSSVSLDLTVEEGGGGENHHLRRVTSSGKAKQHAEGRVEGVEDSVKKVFEDVKETDEWDLLGGDDEDVGSQHKKLD
ncbi:nucleotide-sugar transporter [Pseudohyphozyma bogoriensis]|nr:nucleotide-sugar transporter [Pseudohyphozyma bogoriensis]